jgi:Flp pilus assembly secretin CpaC
VAEKHSRQDLQPANQRWNLWRGRVNQALNCAPFRIGKSTAELHGIHLWFRNSGQWLRKFAAFGLACSVTILTCLPQAVAQQSSFAALAPAAVIANSTETPSVRRPSPKQAMKARELFGKGTHALQNRKSARAAKLFSEAHRLDPGNGVYLAAYEIARQQRIGGMLQLASDDQENGRSASAKQHLLSALQVDPDNPYVQEHLQSLNTEEEPGVIESAPMPQFSRTLIELAPTSARATFHLRASAQQIVQRVLLAYGVTALLDDSVPAKQDRFDLDNASFAEASTALELATGTFIVPLDAQHALVAKDTKQNRSKFERLLLETVFLPGVDPKEMTSSANMIKTVFGVKQVSVDGTKGTLTIRAPEATLRAVNAILSRLYLDKPDVVLDVRIYQVNDSHQETLGVAFPQSLSVFNVSSQLDSIISANQSTIAQLIASGLVNPGDLAGIAALLVGLGLVNGTVLNQPFALFGNGLTLSGLSFGATTGNASLNISNTRELDHVQLRTGDLQAQSFLVGSRYPVVTQSYSAGTQTPTSSTSLAALLSGSTTSNLSTINPLAVAPTVQYIDLGLTLKAKTHVLQGNNVRMELQIKIAALSGGTVNGSPIINNQSFTTAIDVHDGGSALVTSAVSRSESRSLSGIPGLSELPGFGWTASPTTEVITGRLLIVINPHIVGVTHSDVASRIVLLPPQMSTP